MQYTNQRPLTSASPNKLPISNFASVDRDKPRIQTYKPMLVKTDDFSSPISNAFQNKPSDILILKNKIEQLDLKVAQQTETINSIKTELDKLKEQNYELQEKLKHQQTSPTQTTLERRVGDEQKKLKQELLQLSNKFSEIKVDYETKQMSLEEKVRSISQSFESRMKIYFESKMEFEDIIQTINQLANEISLMKSKQTDVPIDETYHVDQNGYLMDSGNNYMLDNGQMIRLNEKQILYLKQHHKLL